MGDLADEVTPHGSRQGQSPLAAPLLAMLDAIPGMVGYWGLDLRNIYANQAYTVYFGMSPEEICGRHMREVLGEALFNQNIPRIEAVLAGERQQFDRTLPDMTGEARHVQVSYVPDHQIGLITGFFVLVTDITTHVQGENRLKESAEQYRALARSIPGSFVLLFDHELQYLIADGPALADFGFTSRDLEGRKACEALPPALVNELTPRYRSALAGETVQWQRTFRDRMFSLTACPVRTPDDKIIAGMVIASDSTEQRRRQGISRALHEVAKSVARNHSSEIIAGQLAASLSEVFNVDTAGVVRFTDGTSGEILAMVPPRLASLPRLLHFDGHDWSAAGRVARTGKPALVRYDPHNGSVVEALVSEGLHTGAAAPIRHRNAPWGAVAIGSKEVGRISPEVLDELASFAELIEIALGNMDAWSTLSEQATLDPLTGLLNRRCFAEQLDLETEQFARHQEPFSLVLIDIDRFKRINDTYGHSVGDRIIVELADRLKSVLRHSEVLARYGGEEFVWLLPHTDCAHALVAAERARAVVGDVEFSVVGQITISLGVCSTEQLGDRHTIIDAADRALYEAKRAGRNAVATHKPPGRLEA
jgi:diguanylate cyclase (GGDEF)-like protein/PAS domain S-box-containing protein